MKEQNFVYFRDLRNGTTQLKFSEFAVTSFYNDVIMQLKSGKVFRAIKYGILFPVAVSIAYFKMKQIIKKYKLQHTDAVSLAKV